MPYYYLSQGRLLLHSPLVAYVVVTVMIGAVSLSNTTCSLHVGPKLDHLTIVERCIANHEHAGLRESAPKLESSMATDATR